MGIKVKLGLVGVVALAGILALLLCAPPVFANGRITPGTELPDHVDLEPAGHHRHTFGWGVG